MSSIASNSTVYTGLTDNPADIKAWDQGAEPGAVLDYVEFSLDPDQLPPYFSKNRAGGNDISVRPAVCWIFFLEETATHAGIGIPLISWGVSVVPNIPLAFAVDLYIQPGVTMDVTFWWHIEP